MITLDDWGIQKIAAAQRNDLAEIIEDRHDLRSTLIASQLPVEQWHGFIGEAPLPTPSSTAFRTTPTA